MAGQILEAKNLLDRLSDQINKNKKIEISDFDFYYNKVIFYLELIGELD